MLEMPRLETARLLIRPFVKEDLHAAHRLFDIELNAEDMGAEKLTTLHVRRIIAETDFDNAGSIAVMRKLGIQIGRNPLPEPPWLQVVGVLENNR